MADRYYGIEFGGDVTSIVEGGSTTATTDVEIRITYDATANNKQALMVALNALTQRLASEPWPLA